MYNYSCSIHKIRVIMIYYPVSSGTDKGMITMIYCWAKRRRAGEAENYIEYIIWGVAERKQIRL